MNRKIYILMFSLLFITSFAYSQSNFGEVKGKVINKSNKSPIEGVLIIAIKDGATKGTTYSDSFGNYNIKSLEAGEYNLLTKFFGYNDSKYNGVVINPNKLTAQNIEITPESNDGSITTKVIDIVDVRNLITVDGDPKVFGKDAITKGPTRGIAGLAKITPGANVKNGQISFLGSRTDGTRTFVDGVAIIGSGLLPNVGQDQVEFIISGVPAMFGDATGGSINITTKGISNRYFNYVELVSSNLTDAYGYNTLEFARTAPVKIVNKGGGEKERVLFGYQISGQLQYQKDNSPTVLGSWAVKEDKLKEIENSPMAPNPDGFGFVPRSSFLTQNDFELNKARLNSQLYAGVIQGKFEYQPSKNTNITFFNTYTYVKSKGYNYNHSLFNYKEYNNNINQVFRTYLKITQKVGYQSSKKLEKGEVAPRASDAFYQIRLDYQSNKNTSMHSEHGENIFDYGYIGKFTKYNVPRYEYRETAQKFIVKNSGGGYDTVTRQGYWEFQGFRDTLITFDKSDLNPIRANYTQNVFDAFRTNFGLQGAPNEALITNFTGILNGFGTPNTYSLWFNPGTLTTGFNKSQQERISIYAIGEVTIATKKASTSTKKEDRSKNRHDLQFGLTFEQNIFSGYGLNAGGLWTLMPQLVNKHLNLDKVISNDYVYNSIHSYDQDGRFLDSVKYNYRIETDKQSTFDKNLRNKLISEGKTDVYGQKITETSFIDVNSLSPDYFDLSMFSSEDLWNKSTAANPFVNYYGYDYLGNRTRKKFGLNDFLNNRENRNISSFTPNYSAIWLQDKFAINDLIFRVGVRIERYDANQQVLKDPYSLLPIQTIGEVTSLNGRNIDHPDNLGDDYAVYVNNAKNPTSILGYRKNNIWYNKDGVEIPNPEILAQQTSNNQIAPLLVNPNITEITKESFKDYAPQINILPRVYFSFPINTTALFFANYDILAQRPTDGATFTPISEYYFLESTQDRFLPNASLKPRTKTMYELGYKQELSKFSALSLIVSYSEIKNDFGLFAFNQAYPVSYTSYNNIDFATNKSFRCEYVLKAQKNLSLTAAYTLLFADGTGSNINSQAALIQANQPNLRSLYPLDVDYRHNLNTSFRFEYESGTDYNGPIWKNKQIFKNSYASFNITGRSGAPYSATVSPTATAQAALGTITRSQTKGNPFGSRMPWQYQTDLKINKAFEIEKSKKMDNHLHSRSINAFIWVQNLFNSKIVEGVYSFTGLPNDDGYLTSADGRLAIESAINQQAFMDQYSIKMNNPFNFAAPRTIRLGLSLQF